MKNKIKRLTAIMLVILMIQSIISVSIITTSAEETQEDVPTKTIYTYGDYQYTVSDEEATITAYSGTRANVVIPGYISGYKVTGLAEKLFCKDENIRKVTFPDTIEIILRRILDLCSNLKSVKTGSGLLRIEDGAFARCYSLSEVDFSRSKKIDVIGQYAFNGCYSIKSMTIPDTVTRIEFAAFKEKIALAVNNKYALKPTITPEGVATKCKWTSSDESIATVSKFGNVTAVSEGTAYITVTTHNGKTATCKVVVG